MVIAALDTNVVVALVDDRDMSYGAEQTAPLQFGDCELYEVLEGPWNMGGADDESVTRLR